MTAADLIVSCLSMVAVAGFQWFAIEVSETRRRECVPFRAQRMRERRR